MFAVFHASPVWWNLRCLPLHLLRSEQHWCGQFARASSRNRGCRHSTVPPRTMTQHSRSACRHTRSESTTGPLSSCLDSPGWSDSMSCRYSANNLSSSSSNSLTRSSISQCRSGCATDVALDWSCWACTTVCCCVITLFRLCAASCPMTPCSISESRLHCSSTNVWRQIKSATCDDSDEDCFSLDLKKAVTNSHDKCRFVDSQR